MEFDDFLEEYLRRIELVPSSTEADLQCLNQLHIAHLTHIPFETFDLIDMKQLNISRDFLFDHLIRQHRGGVCFQLNGIFQWILKKFSFSVQLIPANVFNVDRRSFGSKINHVTLLVTLKNDEKYLCDVGFSRDFLTPLLFQLNSIQFANNGFFRIIQTEDGEFYQLERGFFLENDEQRTFPQTKPLRTRIVQIDPDLLKWTISYRFSIDSLQSNIDMNYFQDSCSYVIHSPDVRLNHLSLCRIHRLEPTIGSYGIVGKYFYQWTFENGFESCENKLIENDEEFRKILNEKFGLIIDRQIELID